MLNALNKIKRTFGRRFLSMSDYKIVFYVMFDLPLQCKETSFFFWQLTF